MIGTKLGPYEIVEELGRGGMATVYRAYQPNIDRYVAIKVIHRAISLDAVSIERFNREGRLIAKLEHPHILPVYDYNGQSDPPYIVMRYLPGGTLKDVTEQGKLPPEEVSHLVNQIASALDYAHRQGVVHRDIKPSNILIDAEGNAFLTDFGIARLMEGTEHLTGTGIAVGTPGYMSPEQGMGAPIDSRADIYSLGVMIYEMLTGRMPYKAETPMAVILKHISDPVPDITQANPDLPPAVNIVIQRAMAKNPADRFASATELARALGAIIGPTSNITPMELRRSVAKTISSLAEKRHAAPKTNMAGDLTPRGAPTSAQSGPASATAPIATPLSDSEGRATTAPRNTTPMLIGGGVVVIIIAIIALLVVRNNNANQEATAASQTAAVVAAEQTKVFESEASLTAQAARTSTNTPVTPSASPSGATSVSPKGSPGSPTAIVAAPTTVLPATATATLTATLTPTPSATPTHTPTYTITPSPTATFTPTITPSFTPTYTPTFVPVRISISPAVLDPATRELMVVIAVQSGEERIVLFHFQVISEGGLVLDDRFEDAPLTKTARLPIKDIPAQTLTIRVSALDGNKEVLTQGDQQFKYAPTPTPTLPPTVTPPPTNTPPAQATEPPTATPSPTPAPPGSLPYINDMEGANPLDNWDYRKEAWNIVPVSGNAVLTGNSGEKDLAIVMGRTQPQWGNPDVRELVITLSMNLTDNSSIGRIIFRYSPKGYYAFQLAPGLMTLTRGQDGNISRGNERPLINIRTAVNAGTSQYYKVMIWSNVNRTYVYLDGQLVLQAEDTGDILPGGSIIFQDINTQNRVRYDNFKIQRPVSASSNFQISDWPSTWYRADLINSKLATDSKSNTYLEVTNSTVGPIINPALPNLYASCRIWSYQGGLEIRFRETKQGSIAFDFVGGDMNINQVDPSGKKVRLQSFPNFYGRSQFFEFDVELYNNEIRLYKSGDMVAQQKVDNIPAAGDIRFAALTPNDAFRIDDCLFVEAVRSPTENAAWAFDKVTMVESRLIRDLNWDWYDQFDSTRTREWWVGGLNAPGELKVDKSNPNHANYLELTYKEGASWRLFNNSSTFFVFGSGRDKTRPADYSDIYLHVNLRIPQRGTAWVAIRTTPSKGGGGLDGFYLAVSRVSSNEYRVKAYGQALNFQPIYYDDLLPSSPDGTIPDWIPLLVVSYLDKIAFFANDHFLGSDQGVPIIGGTVALGVEQGTVADFDDFRLRDVSPETR